jgi:Flp pilus assembly protein TadG
MQYRTPVSQTRRRKSSGQTILENAFTLLPTLAMIFGLTDFGLMIFRWTTLQNAVREGCRYAVTFQVDSSGHQDTSIEDQVTTYAMGLVHTSDDPQTIFVTYYNPNTLAVIASGGNQPGNVVQVSVQGVAFSSIAPLSGGDYSLRTTTPLSLNVYASDILGGYPVGETSVPE